MFRRQIGRTSTDVVENQSKSHQWTDPKNSQTNKIHTTTRAQVPCAAGADCLEALRWLVKMQLLEVVDMAG